MRRSRPRASTHGSIIGVVGALVMLAATWPAAAPDSPVGIDAAFEKFWRARDAQEASKLAADVAQSGVAFDEALGRLKRGRTYASEVPKGVVRLKRQERGEQFFYDVNVPPTYDPGRRYQVRVQLHGGVMGRNTGEPRGNGVINLPSDAEQIYVVPYSWSAAPWWGDVQLENVPAILDSLKRTYNIDENRVVLAGVSDGATATYYFAMRDTTPYASFGSLNGFLMVLANPDVGAQNDLFPNNLLNKPFFMVNGGADPLYPTRAVEPYINHLKEGGVTVDYHPQPGAGHNTSWWPQVKDTFERFVREHPRDPLPAKLTWESTGKPPSNRADWLVIDRLASAPNDLRGLHDLNDVGDPPAEQLFHRPRTFGRVDLVRQGNTVEATTRGVAEFTLLVSPDAFDLSQPVKVVVNGRVAFEGKVDPSLATLLKWAARDNDRTMLFAAELRIRAG